MANDISEAKKYTITEAARVSGLPESTLRYYETIGIITPIERNTNTKRRIYSESDLTFIDTIACLSATGMSIEEMRTYMNNRDKGIAAAADQKQLLEELEIRLNKEQKHLEHRREYVQLKVQYWQAVIDKKETLASAIAAKASKIAKEMKVPKF